MDDIVERAVHPLPPFVEDLGAVRVTVKPVLQHLADDGRGYVLPEERDPGGSGETFKQVPGLGLGFVSLIQTGFEFDGDRDGHTRQLPDSKWEGSTAVSLEGTELVDDRGSGQALRELTILGLGGKSVEPGHGVICEPDGSLGGEGNGEVGDVVSGATAKVKHLHSVEAVHCPQ